MDIGQDRCADLACDVGEDLEAFVEPQPPEALRRTPIGLVVAALEDDGDFAGARDLGDGRSMAQRVLAALDHARSRDEGERTAAAERHASDADLAGRLELTEVRDHRGEDIAVGSAHAGSPASSKPTVARSDAAPSP